MPGFDSVRVVPNAPLGTEEDLAISIDPGTGTDSVRAVRVYTQAQADAVGTFASLDAALDALPRHIKHDVTLTHADGVFTITDLGDWSRFTFAVNAKIILTSASGWVRVATTTSYAVASADNPAWMVTLAADPGFSANLVRGSFMHVLSGTGVGEYRAVRSHAAEVFSHANAYDTPLDATSVVEFMVPGTLFEHADHFTVKGPSGSQDGLEYVDGHHANLVLDGVGIQTPGVNKIVTFQDLHVRLERFTSTKTLATFAGNLVVESAVFDADGGLQALTVYGACRVEASGTLLARGSTFGGIFIQPTGSTRSAYFYGTGFAIDDCSGYAAFVVRFAAQAEIYDSDIKGSGNTATSFFFVSNGARVKVGPSGLTSLPSAVADISLDGEIVTYAELDADPDKAALSARGSSFFAADV